MSTSETFNDPRLTEARTTEILSRWFKPNVVAPMLYRHIPGLGDRTPVELVGNGEEAELIACYERIFEASNTA